MKRYISILIAGFGALGGLSATAQISTFPAPPPLPESRPPAEPVSPSPDNRAVTPPASSDASATEAAKTPSNTGSSSKAGLSAATLSSMAALDDKITLKPGDTVSFRVIEDRDEPVTRTVTDNGEVDFPYIGRVKVQDRTCHAVALDVKKRLEVDYYKQATVIVGLDLIFDNEDKTKPKDMAWVMGEVRQVGPVELAKNQPMTVSQLVIRAGGFGDFADKHKVKLIHKIIGGTSAPEPATDGTDTRDYQTVDVGAVFAGKSAADPVVKGGDYVIVPKVWIKL